MRHTDYQPARNRWAFAADLAWLLTVLVGGLAATALVTWTIYDVLLGVVQ